MFYKYQTMLSVGILHVVATMARFCGFPYNPAPPLDAAKEAGGWAGFSAGVLMDRPQM
jgi:hypothetical protein